MFRDKAICWRLCGRGIARRPHEGWQLCPEMVVVTVVDSRGYSRRCIQQAFDLRLMQGPLPAHDLSELNGNNWRSRARTYRPTQ